LCKPFDVRPFLSHVGIGKGRALLGTYAIFSVQKELEKKGDEEEHPDPDDEQGHPTGSQEIWVADL
jgi:hypothetical protein